MEKKKLLLLDFRIRMTKNIFNIEKSDPDEIGTLFSDYDELAVGENNRYKGKNFLSTIACWI